ncbi:MAG: small basic protein [Actinobacteria bacterium]|nr:small basic protein [Actinomycetota bacterium]
MSIDRSLRSKDSLARHRNVLTRSERLDKLEEEERWREGDSVLALAKVVHRKAVVSKKVKADAETTEGEAAAMSGSTEGATPAGQSEQSKS